MRDEEASTPLLSSSRKEVESNRNVLLCSSSSGGESDRSLDIVDATPVHSRQDSLELLIPSFSSFSRSSSLFTSAMSLASTIVGGSCLCLPFLLQQFGLVYGISLLAVCAAASAFSLDLLISCSRRGKGATYEAIAVNAFGRIGSAVTTIALFLLLIIAILAYSLLIESLLELLLPYNLIWWKNKIVLFIVFVFLTPLSSGRNLHNLAVASSLSVFAMFLLACILGFRAFQSQHCHLLHFLWPAIDCDWKNSGIAISAFCCVFNTLDVTAALQRPTRVRIRTLLGIVMFGTFFLYACIGLFGLCFAGHEVRANIFQNFHLNDDLAKWAMFGLFATLSLSLPLLIVPLRSLLEKSSTWITASLRYFNNHEDMQSSLFCSQFCNTTGTIYLLTWLICLFIHPDIVVQLWSWVGSYSCLILSFILPCAIFMKLHWRKCKSITLRFVLAALLLTVSIIILCVNIAT